MTYLLPSGSVSCPRLFKLLGAWRSGPQTVRGSMLAGCWLHALWCLQVWAPNSLGQHVGRLQLPAQAMFEGANLDVRQLQLQQAQHGNSGMGPASGTVSPPTWQWPAEGPYTFGRWRTAIERWVNQQEQLRRVATHLGGSRAAVLCLPDRWAAAIDRWPVCTVLLLSGGQQSCHACLALGAL